MVIKIKDPKRWVLLPDGNVINLEGQGRRPVRLEINAVAHAAFKVVYPDDTMGFLAAFQGMEVIEFVADGPCEVWCTSDDEVYFFTDDSRNIAFVNDGKVSFAVPHQRRGPSEQIIYMQSLMLRNEQRRAAKLEGAVAALQAERARSENSSPDGTGAVSAAAGDPPVQPAVDPGAEGVAKRPDPAA